ncbi:MAG: BON domain-containing protein [Thermoguttaceae bacterium]|jgi:osmotically-inducible protein OsmY
MGMSAGTAPQGMAMPMTATQQLTQTRRPGGFVGATAQQMQQNFAGAAQVNGAGASAGSFNPLQGGPSMPQSQAGGMRYPGAGGPSVQGGQSQVPVRCTLHASFDYPHRQSTAVTAALERLLARTPALQVRKPIQVELAGETAVLRGEVATEHDRVLAGQLARLEVGIGAVQNEIEVVGSTPANTDKPPANTLPANTLPAGTPGANTPGANTPDPKAPARRPASEILQDAPEPPTRSDSR